MPTERADTATENALMAAPLHPGTTVIRNASSNYMVQDLCFYLQMLGVRVEGVGTTTLTVTGLETIDVFTHVWSKEQRTFVQGPHKCFKRSEYVAPE